MSGTLPRFSSYQTGGVAGERIEILVNCVGQSGTSFKLKAYNSTLAQNVPGGDLFPNGPFANALARIDFNVFIIN